MYRRSIFSINIHLMDSRYLSLKQLMVEIKNNLSVGNESMELQLIMH